MVDHRVMGTNSARTSPTPEAVEAAARAKLRELIRENPALAARIIAAVKSPPALPPRGRRKNG